MPTLQKLADNGLMCSQWIHGVSGGQDLIPNVSICALSSVLG
jgi:hypothetical protein